MLKHSDAYHAQNREPRLVVYFALPRRRRYAIGHPYYFQSRWRTCTQPHPSFSSEPLTRPLTDRIRILGQLVFWFQLYHQLEYISWQLFWESRRDSCKSRMLQYVLDDHMRKTLQAAALFQSQALFFKALSDLGVSPHLVHCRATSIQSVDRVFRIFPPPLNFTSMCALWTFR